MHARASTATPLTVGGVCCVFRIERMTSNAVSFPGVRSTWSVPPKHILTARNDFHVSRVDACPIATKVVNTEPGRDWPNQCFVRQPVGQQHLLSSSFKSVFLTDVDVVYTIACALNGTTPIPTPRFIVQNDLVTKTFREFMRIQLDLLSSGKQSYGHLNNSCLRDTHLFGRFANQTYSGCAQAIAGGVSCWHDLYVALFALHIKTEVEV
jgi:hypothetical protein